MHKNLATLLQDKFSLSPDASVMDEWKILNTFDLKTKKQCEEELSDGRGHENLINIAKCWVIIEDEMALAEFVELLLIGAAKGLRVVQLQNMFSDFNFTGMGYFLLHVEVLSKDRKAKHVCEVRVEASHIFRLRQEEKIRHAHKKLEQYFMGDTMEESRKKLDIFDRLHGEGVDSGIALAQEILCGDDFGRLVALDEVSSLMGEFTVVHKCRKKLLKMIEERGASEEIQLRMLDDLCTCCRGLQLFGEAADYAKRAVEGKKRVFGEAHLETLRSMRTVAKLTTW